MKVVYIRTRDWFDLPAHDNAAPSMVPAEFDDIFDIESDTLDRMMTGFAPDPEPDYQSPLDFFRRSHHRRHDDDDAP